MKKAPVRDRGFCTDRSPRRVGAGRRIRTPDLLITNQLHYQLCYAGKKQRRQPRRKPIITKLAGQGKGLFGPL